MASLDDASDGGHALDAFASLDLGSNALSYKSCTMTQDADQRWRATYAYSLQGQEHLAHVIVPAGAMNDECRRVLAHADLVLLCGQWMITPCRRILCEAMPLSDAQKSFWIQFYREAFAEFALENNLKEDACDVSVEADPIDEEKAPVETSPDNVRLLCGLSGGRGSLVSWALCRKQPRVASVDWLHIGNAHSKRLRGVVEQTGGSIRIAEVSGLAAGGPRAARCAFQGVAVAALLGYDGFVVGHARSAGEGNGVVYGGREVNHQFDQSLKWEDKIRKYLRHLSTVAYVSPLQHMWALQVTGSSAGRRNSSRSTPCSGRATTLSATGGAPPAQSAPRSSAWYRPSATTRRPSSTAWICTGRRTWSPFLMSWSGKKRLSPASARPARRSSLWRWRGGGEKAGSARSWPPTRTGKCPPRAC